MASKPLRHLDEDTRALHDSNKTLSALQGTTRPVVRGSVTQPARSFNKPRFEEPLGHQRRDSFFT
ncbi:hypothetical protein BFJ63_vAg354 [Fusarium oxysporum f. sp. narcissi]|uniref:Uncharacterized protein n=3 Tax=Fusarium oxysporum TaxID=5507 RepID=A0A420PUH7_FUSOX|nr:hypothetical protein NW765_000414 [Fusarium oxysporum]RKK20965.1 hypothetical protein BFJ65_g7653 [Fusarium oxysporum f. sp. cepae]RYC97194.1 hypothetical protein BFJ63_vAg354 [Fusarium oxysporum f. sp. narcissi]KAJ9422427.1 hypothetical protein QL093DRAFT_2314620 [Fusarium oxysporum]RKK63763.1 hypothetical protein BFJ66_g359 [Fusarium oxysporum f. sp. cepae]